MCASLCECVCMCVCVYYAPALMTQHSPVPMNSTRLLILLILLISPNLLTSLTLLSIPLDPTDPAPPSDPPDPTRLTNPIANLNLTKLTCVTVLFHPETTGLSEYSSLLGHLQA
jgi:hypothetical protein